MEKQTSYFSSKLLQNTLQCSKKGDRVHVIGIYDEQIPLLSENDTLSMIEPIQYRKIQWIDEENRIQTGFQFIYPKTQESQIFTEDMEPYKGTIDHEHLQYADDPKLMSVDQAETFTRKYLKINKFIITRLWDTTYREAREMGYHSMEALQRAWDDNNQIKWEMCPMVWKLSGVVQ